MNDLNKLYKAILMAIGGVVKPTSQVVLSVGNKEIDIKVDGMFLYLPVTEVLESTETSDKVFFHPGCEHITSKETEIFKIIRRMVGIRLLELFKKYPVVLASIAAGKEKRNWNQNILNILEPLKEAKKKTVDELEGIMARFTVEIDDNGVDTRFIHLKVSKGAGRSQTSGGGKVYHKTKPVFPMYSEIIKRLSQSEGQADNQTVELNGVSVSRGALKLLAHLFQVIIPAVSDPESASYESTNSAASRMISYFGCFEQIAEQMNRIQNMFRGDFDKLGIYPIDLSWTEQMEELPTLYRQVPSLDYNTHNTQDEAAENTNAMNGMANMFSVSSNNHQPAVQQHNQLQQPQSVNGHQLGIPMTGVVDGFVVTPPPMITGDRYIRYEIDHYANQIRHYALNTLTNSQVVYVCTRSGTMLQRNDATATAQPSGIPGLGIPGLGINPLMAMMGMGGAGGLTPQQMMMMQMAGGMMQPQATPASSGGSVVTNNGFDNPMY